MTERSEYPQLRSVYLELTVAIPGPLLTDPVSDAVYKVKYVHTGSDTDLSFEQESIMTEDFRPDDWMWAVRSTDKYNVVLKATSVELGDPCSRAETGIQALLAECEADKTLARSPRRLLDRLKAL